MTFLDKGGNLKEANRSDNALRGVRAKREAEDAGMSYRDFPRSSVGHTISSFQTKSTARVFTG